MTKRDKFRFWARCQHSFSIGEAMEFWQTLGNTVPEQFLVDDILRGIYNFRILRRGPKGGIYSKRSVWTARPMGSD